MDGRFKRYSNGSNACIDDDDKLYGNRHNQWMQQHSGIYGHGESKSKHKCKLPEHLCRSDSELNSNGRDELYVDRRLGVNSHTDDPNLNDDDDLYGNGNNGKL